MLDWYENLQKDEIPPEWMWPFDDELEVHFDQVEEDRKNRTSSGSQTANDSGDGGRMMSNELARGKR